MIRSSILRTSLLSLFLYAGIIGAAGQGVVSLYIKDDPTSYLVANIPADDPRLAEAMDLPADPAKSHIWRWLELKQTFDGYVRKDYITKGLTVQVGALIYFKPGDEDAFLGVLQDGAKAEVLESAGDYVKVAVEASLPVFYESEKPSVAAKTEMKAPQPPPVTDFEPESAVVQDDSAYDSPADITPSGPYPGEHIDRILEGKLVAYKPAFSNPWKKPTYQWEILNRRKKRMAFVDTNSLILNRSIEYYDGKQVTLSGSIYQINKGRDLVIVANQLTVQ
jgi:hypothetical protein